MCNTTDPHTAWLNEWRSEGALFDKAVLEHPDEFSTAALGHLERLNELRKKLSGTMAATEAGMKAQIEWLTKEMSVDPAELITQLELASKSL